MTLLSFQKMLALLVLPAGFVWVLLLAASLYGFRRKRWKPAWFTLGLALLYAAAGNVPLGAMLLARLEATVPRVDPVTVEPFEVVFVLGGGVDDNAWGDPQLGSSGDRLYQAARMWHAGKARLLVASGVARGGARGFRNGGELSRVLWQSLGIPGQAILVVEEPCWITRDEIAAYRRLQTRFGWQRMALVSSASHMPRAMALADKAGLKVTPIGADWRGQPPGFACKWLVPQAEGFVAVQVACWELLGRSVGR